MNAFSEILDPPLRAPHLPILDTQLYVNFDCQYFSCVHLYHLLVHLHLLRIDYVDYVENVRQ